MTNEEDEQQRWKNQMNFIVEQQARIDTALETLATNMSVLTTSMNGLTTIMAGLTTTMAGLATMVSALSTSVSEQTRTVDNLIIANKDTRGLAEHAARLAIATSRLLTKHMEEGNG